MRLLPRVWPLTDAGPFLPKGSGVSPGNRAGQRRLTRWTVPVDLVRCCAVEGRLLGNDCARKQPAVWGTGHSAVPSPPGSRPAGSRAVNFHLAGLHHPLHVLDDDVYVF